MARNIIVTGATGKQGRSFIHALLNGPTDNLHSPYHVWAVTRNPSSTAAVRLSEAEKSHAQRITIIKGDLNDAARMRDIFTQAAAADGGLFGAFIVLAYAGLGQKSDEEKRQGKLLAELALEFKVEAFVYSSTIPPGPNTGDAYDGSHQAKGEIERYCEQLGEKGLNWIFVRPGFFMENFDGFMGSLAVAILSQGLKKETNIALVASEDIGRVAAGIFTDHKRYIQQALSITSGCETMTDIMMAYQSVTGKHMPATPGFLAKILLRTSGGARNVVKEIERNYEARTNGEYSSFDAEVSLAKSVCELQSYSAWVTARSKGSS